VGEVELETLVGLDAGDGSHAEGAVAVCGR
jgi:hypothetical protein